MVRDAPEVAIKNLIRDNWDATNTESITPSIHHGWVDPGASSLEVTVSNPEELPLDGGETGYSGINQDGKPVQNFTGTVEVNAWSDRDRTTENPRKMAWLMRVEIGRILHENYDPRPTYDIYPLADLGANRIVEEDDEPGEATTWRYAVTAGYGYRSEPS